MKPDDRKIIGEHLNEIEEERKEERERHPLTEELFKFGENVEKLKELIESKKPGFDEIKEIKNAAVDSLVKNVELLNEELKNKGEIMSQCSLEHNIRSFLCTFNNTMDAIREGKAKPEDLSAGRIVNIAEIRSLLKVINFYLANTGRDKKVLAIETESNFGLAGEYDNKFRRKDFSEKEKSQLSYNEYLLLFYLIKNNGGILKADFDSIIQQLKNKETILSADLILDASRLGNNGKVYLDLTDIEKNPGKIVYN